MTAASTKTVLVLGASYGGARAARILADELPRDWRVIVLERNSHMNHVYVFPRFVVMPEHAPKGFVPYTRAFCPEPSETASSASSASSSHSTGDDELENGKGKAANGSHENGSRANGSAESSKGKEGDGPVPLSTDGRHMALQGLVTRIGAHSVTFLAPSPSYDHILDSGKIVTPPAEVTEHTLPFDYLVYALGAGLPAPCDVWGEPGRAPIPARGSKVGGVAWMRAYHDQIAAAASITIIGGGALGIQFAGDIKERWPAKAVTLVHSRERLMPVYPRAMHDEIVRRLRELGVKLILGERVMEWPAEGAAKKRIKTSGGTVLESDLVMACTGQKPRTHLLQGLANIDPVSGRIRVRGSMQIEPLSIAETDLAAAEAENGLAEKMHGLAVHDHPLGHVFAIGDCAHTAAIQAGHTAYFMGEVAARNIVRLVKGEKEELEVYKPGPPAIKITLGRWHYATCLAGEVTAGDDGVDDLAARLMWGPLNAEGLPDDA